MEHKQTSIIIAGAAPDTGNHGVSALCQSAVLGLAERGCTHFTLLDNGGGHALAQRLVANLPQKICTLTFQGGKRIYRDGNMHNVRLRHMFGLPSPILTAIKNADALLDVSGGDSFTDLYGLSRFEQIVRPKELALAVGTPLILLPQTYGPFRSKKSREVARKIVAHSALAFARDVDSFGHMQALLGSAFDPERHRLGVDLAFGLPLESTRAGITAQIGINVSGLLWNEEQQSRERFGLKANYKECLRSFSRYILENTDLGIRLLPHVTPNNSAENDLVACQNLKAQLPTHMADRVAIEENANTPSQLKGVISQLDWFVGARMHATIAALSSCTPTANMAYSRKSRGVFDRCGVADQVVDMRRLSTGALIAGLIKSFHSRANQKKVLCKQLPFVARAWSMQMDSINTAVTVRSPNREAAYV